MTMIQSPSSIRQTSLPLREQKPRANIEWWVTAVWALHFFVTIGVMLVAYFDNYETRKFITIDGGKLGLECRRAFLNVMEDNPDQAIYCCGETHELSNTILCNPPPSFMLFARRLSRLPDAVILPLFPMIIQFGYYVYQTFFPASEPSKWQITRTKRRLSMYLTLIFFRTFILYLFMDRMEKIFVPMDPNAVCWYHDLTRGRGTCYGRNSDFSDHIVLYYAQLLPLTLMEVLHWFGCLSRKMSQTRNNVPLERIWIISAALMAGGLLHLYVITCFNAYKTTSYFHSGTEILVGYLVSLTVQIPLCLMQTSNLWPELRVYFFDDDHANEPRIAE